MTPAFWGAALSRQDGSPADGIHLLWTTPYAAGYSEGGYDIQRRGARHREEKSCVTLSESDLETLHSELRLLTSACEIAVRATPCPQWPGSVPDSPFRDDDEGELPCVDFGQLRDRRTVDTIDGLQLAAFDAAGVPRPHVQLRVLGGLRGIDCVNHLEIALPAPSRRVFVTLVDFAQSSKLAARSARGDVVAAANAAGSLGEPETIGLEGEGIVSVAIVAPADETLLLRLCWEPSPGAVGERCVELDELGSGEHPNPLRLADAEFTALDAQGAPMAHSVVQSMGGSTGLDCARTLHVSLTRSAVEVQLGLVTFASPAIVRALGSDGSLIGTVSTLEHGQPESVTITGSSIAALVITAPMNETLLLELCARAEAGSRTDLAPAGRPLSSASHPSREVALAANTTMLAARPSTCLCYRLRANGQHHVVEAIAQVPWVLVIAMREGKPLDSRFLEDASGIQAAAFPGRWVDEVLLYTGQRVAGLTVCVDVAPSPEDEAKEWSGVPYIAKGVQLPVRGVNPALAGAADELALAQSRLVAGESIDESAFADLASTMNETVSAGLASPMWHTMLTRERFEDPFIEVRPWPYSLSLAAIAEWRRALGLGYLDHGAGLIPGRRYDYRISGHFKRRDVEERLLAFHTIPSGTTLPATFHLGSVRFASPAPKVVELYPPVPMSVLHGTGRKGIRLTPSHGAPALTIGFDAPITRVALEMEPALAGAMDYTAKTSDYILGLSGTTATGSIVAAPRNTLEFAEPIDTLELRGSGFLYGLRVLAPTGGDPDDVLDLSVIVPDVQYTATGLPPPPTVLGTTNLQQPIMPGDPSVTTQSPPQPLGFRLAWIPPATSSGGPLPWPPDLGAAPPFDVLGFHLERRRVDTGGAFEEIDGHPIPTVFFGNRGSRADPPALWFGIDLLATFPEVVTPRPPVDPWMSIEDILRSAARPGGPPPGSLHQYRVFSVDAIGRRSATATTGSIVRLEKRIPPPRPPGPGDTPPPGVVRPAGVRARILQASDPDLPPDDVALLGANANAIVLEWGWGADERDRDPFAAEFRVYWQPLPPDLIHGILHSPAVLVGGVYEMSCTLDQPLAVDAMKGAYFLAPSYPFKVDSHTGGANITIRFEPSVLHPGTVPYAATFDFTPVLSGAELRPSGWQERTAVVPIGPGPPVPFVFRDVLTIDAAHPRVRVWVGVSSADGQSYVPDELSAVWLNGGRPGNESSIAAVVAEARYLGRPSFVVPPPLPAVPEDVSPEPVGPTVSVARNLPALLPAVVIPPGHTVVFERLEVGALAEAMSNRPDGSVGVLFADRSTTSYAPGNPVDQSTLREEIASGEPARIENRFLMDLFLRYQARFESLWRRALPMPVAFGAVTDVLPNKAERWLHRIRLVDPAGHISEGAAILPRLVRVASTRTPSAPELTVENSATDSLAVAARVRQAFDIQWVILFALAVPDPSPLDPRVRERAQLLRIPDRRDLYPADGIRLRLADGTLLAPIDAVDIAAAGTVEVPDVRVPATLKPGFAMRVSAWAVTMTRDGIPSRATGPVTAHTGPVPLVVPGLVITAAATTDIAMWGPLAVPAEVSIERSADGGLSWTRVSPWLPPTATTYSLPGSGPRVYRLVLRGTSGQSPATGPATIPT